MSIKTNNQKKKKWRGKDKTNKKEEKIINGNGKIREDYYVEGRRSRTLYHLYLYLFIYIVIL